jgi:uncharacterized damage-inducible protein DinB
MPDSTVVTTPEELLEHWQGHRRVTRRMIETFPEKELFEYSIGGMRTFAQLTGEMLRMAVPIATGVATGKWGKWSDEGDPKTRDEILRLWDESTAELNRVWKTIPPHRFQEEDAAFGQWKGTGIWLIQYAIDNEIHHRGQGYVYLRSLGIDPPAFYDRS